MRLSALISRFTICVVLLSLSLGPSEARAQTVGAGSPAEGAEPGEGGSMEPVHVWEASLAPKAVPESALTVALLPEVQEQTSGNAASHYLEIVAEVASVDVPRDEYEELRRMPLSELREHLAPSWLTGNRSVLEMLRVASRREWVRWDRPIREKGFGIYLPSLGHYRKVARLLDVQIRFDLAHGRIDRVIERLKSGFAMARHIAEGPTLIEALVGNSIASTMMDRVEELVSRPEAPNLYWALTRLPDPMIDLRRSLRHELAIVDLWMPELEAARRGELSADRARRVLAQVNGLRSGGASSSPWAKAERVLAALRDYPEAKRMLRERGYTAEEIEAIPVPTAILMHRLDQYDRLRGEVAKWTSLPYWQARRKREELREMIDRAAARREGNPLLGLTPNLIAALKAPARLHQRIAALRTVEAVRHHAAEHGGELPASLDAIEGLPIAIDPFTGEPLVYRVDGGTFTIESGVELRSGEQPPLRYRITLRRNSDEQSSE